MNREIISIWDYPVIKNTLEHIRVEDCKKELINTISPNSYGLAVKDTKVKEALQNSDLLILDGLYFGWAALFSKGIKINRITGWDAFQHFSKEMNENSGKVFFLGSAEETLHKIKVRYKKEFPNIEVGSYSPPFKDVFSDEDNLLMRKKINEFKPNILFVGMTAPKQEVWSYQNKKFLDVNVICTIGNAFDWYAGNSKRPAVIWQKLGLEWLIRIFHRPEIFRRNIGNQMLFFWHLFLTIIGIKKHD
jgi:N-acetylglucosaminyldiphosphoundecaprenol N-acetyl-beta-D-mannosaminyltransferase